MLKKTFRPPINTDEHRFQDCKDLVFNRRSSAFIGCQIWLRLFPQPANLTFALAARVGLSRDGATEPVAALAKVKSVPQSDRDRLRCATQVPREGRSGPAPLSGIRVS